MAPTAIRNIVDALVSPPEVLIVRNRVLIVDDESAIRFGVRSFLETQGYDVEEASTCQGAEEGFKNWKPDIALIDYLLEDGNALDLLPRLKSADPSVPIVILTAHGSIDLAVRAIKEGADQFLTKPLELPALLVVLQRLLENARNRNNQQASSSRRARGSLDPFLGDSQAIKQLADQSRKLLAADSPVLILGETGSGKGILANWLHNNGPRGEEAFVDLNCAGFSAELLESEIFGHEKGAFTGAASSKMGLLEVAHRGTVFLDEIGDMAPQIQPKLLKVLEEKRFRRLGDVRDRRIDVRLIAATHQDLRKLVGEKKFRSDLYFRVSAIPLTVPPLRDRIQDIPIIAERLLAQFAADLAYGEVHLAPDAIQALQSYAWPGNIRELRNVLERALLLGDKRVLDNKSLRFDEIESDDGDVDVTLSEMERRHIERVLKRERGQVERAALALGIPRSSLYQKIKKYGISLSRS
jgi:DNA-binding NtrC family response regulator